MEKTKIITIALMFTIVLIVSLTSKFKSSKQYEVSKTMKLLPFWVKYLGVLIIVLSILFHYINLSDQATVLGSLWQFGFGIGLIIIGLSKEKIEDEMTMSIRLNSVFISFFYGVILHIILVLLEILDGGDVNSYSSLYFANNILLMYVFIFHVTKKRMR